jgi:predicted component of type VI protein secretion system
VLGGVLFYRATFEAITLFCGDVLDSDVIAEDFVELMPGKSDTVEAKPDGDVIKINGRDDE